jgi:NADP-dependent 3-hydroxy acid dehydrogenase YdfG
MAKPRVWFITGTSSGFGRNLAEEALKRGDCVVATARKPETIKDLEKQYPKQALALRLDVTKKPTIAAAVTKAIAKFKRIDVLVNNAGYGLFGALEDVQQKEVQRIFDTNVFGLLQVTQAVLPQMRKRKSGHILNISSVVGQMSFPSIGIYASTKHAVEGLSEALSKEVEGFGIKVTIIEPGYFQTDFGSRGLMWSKPSAPYKALHKQMDERFKAMAAGEHGDPRKAALAMIQAVDSPETPYRLALGGDSVGMIRGALAAKAADVAKWEEISLSTAASK